MLPAIKAQAERDHMKSTKAALNAGALGEISVEVDNTHQCGRRGPVML